MLILPGALPVVPPSEQAFAVQPAPSPVKTVSPIAQSAKPRNETGQGTGNQHGAILAPRPDLDKPTGPSPAFEANLLEAEREKQRAGPDIEPEMEKAQEPYTQAPIPQARVDITF